MLRRHFRLLRSEPRILSFGALCAFLSTPGQTFFIALFVGSFGASAGLNAGQLGALYLVATLASASLLPFAGHWIDRIDLRLYVSLVVAALALACFSAALAAGPFGLLLAFLLLRLTGQGLMMHVDVTSIARYFGANRGLALSLTAMGFPLAIGIAPPLTVHLIEVLGWRLTYGAIGVGVLIGAIPVLLWLIWTNGAFYRPPAATDEQTPPRAWDGLRIVGRTRYFWLALPILLYMPFASTALTFHVEAVGLARGWSRELVATAFSGFAIGHLAGLFLSGFIVDRLTARVMLPLMNLPLFLGLSVLALLTHPIALFVFLGCLGLSSGLVQTSVGAVWAEVYGIARLGTIRSFATMLMVAGTAAGPAMLGYGLDTGFTVPVICLLLLGYGLIASILAVFGVTVRVPQAAGE